MISARLSRPSAFWLHYFFLCMLAAAEGISIPFFGSFRQTTVRTTTSAPVPHHQLPHPYHQQFRDQRIINADHGGLGLPLQSSSYAGGYSPWLSGTKDQFIRNQLVILHPDSPLNREAWKESGYLNPDFDPTPRKSNNASSTPKPSPARPTQLRARKLHRKSKQHQNQNQNQNEQTFTNVPKQQPTTVNEPGPVATSPDIESSPNTITNENAQPTFLSGGGGLYDLPAYSLLRDMNVDLENGTPIYASPDQPILLNGNLLFPITAPMYPFHHQHQPRGGYHSQHTLPPEAMIQFLKSPEQELSPLARPQVKLPFPLSHDCSASGGGSGSRPLQFVVLPIVEPVAPLKPIFPKPSFLSPQYGQFPYIPPFNLFKRPPVPNSQDPSGSGVSGQFVPILNRPAPPHPFVFVQSLPLELIGQNQEMDVIQSAAPSTNSENTIKDIPIAAPQPSPSPVPVTASASRPSLPPQIDHGPTRPLPLIVIEKVKGPGQPPNSPLAPGATVVEISKQSIQKSSGSGSSPLSTISVVQPITAPGSKPPTHKEQQEIQKAIEKLVPVAAAVLENVEQQQLKKKEQEGRGRDISNANVDVSAPIALPVTSNEKVQQVANSVVPVDMNDQERTPLRPSLRPETNQESVVGGIPPINAKPQHKRPDISSSEEIGTSSTNLSGVEVTEA